MPPKPEIHLHLLFMPYLQKDEYLVWVAEPQRNLYLRLNPHRQLLKKLFFTGWRIALLLTLLLPLPLFAFRALLEAVTKNSLVIVDYLWLFSLLALIWFFVGET